MSDVIGEFEPQEQVEYVTPTRRALRVSPEAQATERFINEPPPRIKPKMSVPALVARAVLMALAAGLGLWILPILFRQHSWMWFTIFALAILLVFIIYSTRRFVPAKYIFPGAFFMAVLLIVPVIMTIHYSFTNFGDGFRGTKEQAINNIVANSVEQTPGGAMFNVAYGVREGADVATGPFTFFLINQADVEGGAPQIFFGDEETPVTAFDGSATVENGRVTGVDGYQMLTPHEVNAVFSQLQNTAIPVDDVSAIKPLGINTAFQGRTAIQYDEATDTLTNINTGEVYHVGYIGGNQFWVDANGNRAFTQSWLQNVGFANYTRLLTDHAIQQQFLSAFGWTLLFAFGSVLLSFLVGYILAMVLNDPRLKFRKLMRSLLLLPYAIPGFISILIWSNFYNRDFGLINQFLGTHINWFGEANWARLAIFITNTWLGFPYMFIVCTGALQSIPADVKEAAAIDGASGLQRTLRITTPLLLVSVAPLLVSSFAFNFNNFNMIQLLTQGGPTQAGNVRGSTDILLSMIYRIAFGGAGAQFGFASAVSVGLFILTGLLAAIQFRMTRKLEDFN
ncbi:MAG: ABC transporter permease subunit [Cellulomonadaceae bacterium]|jgi:arabinogalactan oligomer/maltooligosaccharide transport system permease protein|nr:ABC transporter permease subunit [Cellulomonadaceae bacterium]